jgi:predicted PurR-regulated permease PerM
MSDRSQVESLEADEPGRRFVRRAIVAVGVAAATILLLVVLGRAVDVALVTFAGVLLGVFLLALRDGVTRATGLPNGLALALVTVALSALVVGGVVSLAAPMVEQLDELSDELPRLWAQARATLEQHGWGRWVIDLVANDEALEAVSLGSIASFGTELFVFLVGFLVVGFFVAVQPRLYVDGLVALFPLRARERAHRVLEEMGATLRWFLVARAIAMILVGISTAILLRVLGIPFALLLATIAGLFTFVPYLGPIVSAVPILVVSLFEGPRQAVLAVGLYTLIQSVEGYIFDPLIMQRVVRIPPAVTVVAQLLGAVLFGALGIVLAMPLAAVFQVLVRRAYREDLLGEPLETVDDEAPSEGSRSDVQPSCSAHPSRGGASGTGFMSIR